MSVAELYDRDILEAMDHAERLFDLFSLQDKADSSINSCSTGQRKKAALCTALITNAPLMLMDEPFSGGLDPGGIVALKHVLKRMSKNANDGLDYNRCFYHTRSRNHRGRRGQNRDHSRSISNCIRNANGVV